MQKVNSRLYRKLRSIIRAGKRRLSGSAPRVEWTPGLPPGLPVELLDQVCRDVQSRPLSRSKFEHLSGWKESGAYRVEATLRGGKRWRLIYKDANYALDQLPALKGLPYRPGPPEFTLYHNPPELLVSFLPQCYWCEETQPNLRYRYLLEDLSEQYVRIRGEVDLLAAVEMLLPLHGALESCWFEAESGLLRYDKAASSQLEFYTSEILGCYQQKHPGQTIDEFLKYWPEIQKIHRDIHLFDQPLFTVVHGDLNTTNIYRGQRQRDDFRLVDWEWAGWGNTYLDLACLLKRAEPELEERALQIYAGSRPLRTLSEHRVAYQWSQLDRGLLDASYIAAQVLDNPYRSDWNAVGFVEDSLREVVRLTKNLHKIMES